MALTTAIVAGGLALASGAMAAVGNYQSSKAQSQAQKQQAYNEEYQADLNEARAGLAQEAGNLEAEKRAEQIRRDAGSARVGFAANGLLVDNSGTVADVDDANAAYGAQDVNTIMRNAQMEAWGFHTNAQMNRQNAASYRAAAKTTRHLGKLGLAGGIMSTAGNTASAAYSGYQMGGAISGNGKGASGGGKMAGNDFSGTSGVQFLA